MPMVRIKNKGRGDRVFFSKNGNPFTVPKNGGEVEQEMTDNDLAYLQELAEKEDQRELLEVSGVRPRSPADDDRDKKPAAKR
jgi:hypothetical protein